MGHAKGVFVYAQGAHELRLGPLQVDASLRRITGIVEPLLVTLLSLVVGTILLSVLLPLIGIMTSIG